LVGNAVLSLLSSIVGGVLVLAGQTLARRHEDRRLWLTRLYEAAGDLATSYLQEAARVNDSRRSGKGREGRGGHLWHGPQEGGSLWSQDPRAKNETTTGSTGQS
jgi:hypothetical protein